MDAIDYKALLILQKDGRATWATLGSALHLTPPAVADRVRRLEETGVITGYAALLNPDTVGVGLTAFVSVSVASHSRRAAFLKLAGRTPEILECHHTAGDDDFLLKVRCRGTAELETLLTTTLKGAGGVARTRTVIVLSTEKETHALPLSGVDA
jgi:Lrp/AsnC family leucine-responsive transcriptional regulator